MQAFLFIALNISFDFLLSCRDFAESQLTAVGVPLFTAGRFSVGAFSILSPPLTSAASTPRCLGIALFGSFLTGTQCFLGLDVCFSSQVGEFPAVCLQCSVAPFSLSPSGTPVVRVLVRLMLPSRSRKPVLPIYLYFLLVLFSVVISTLSFPSLVCSAVSLAQLLIPSSAFPF